MKKLVSKLLGYLISFAPVSSFNSNNYSYADIFGSSKLTSGVRVMTEKEFQTACDYVNEKIDEYIERYLDSPLGRKLEYKIFDNLTKRGNNADDENIPPSFKKKRFDEITIDSEQNDLCLVFNANLPSAICRHWVSFFDQNYFSRTERKYTALGYKINADNAHVVFILCYYPDDNPKKKQWVVLDPMAQLCWKINCLWLYDILLKKSPEGLSDTKQEELIRRLYEATMLAYYMPNSELPNKWIENNGFLGIPLEKFCIYGKYEDAEAVSQIFWTREQLGFSTGWLTKKIGRTNNLNCFLRHIYSADELEHLSSLRKQVEYENQPWYNKFYEFASGKYEKLLENANNKYREIQENIVEKWDKITDKMCLIDLPLDIEFSDDDFMGFGS